MLMTADDAKNHDSYLARFLSTGEAHIIGKGRVVQVKVVLTHIRLPINIIITFRKSHTRYTTMQLTQARKKDKASSLACVLSAHLFAHILLLFSAAAQGLVDVHRGALCEPHQDTS